MSASTATATNNKRLVEETLKSVGDPFQQLASGIRRAQECGQCRQKKTVVVTKARSYRKQVAFCASCLSDMLCALCNATHRRKR